MLQLLFMAHTLILCQQQSPAVSLSGKVVPTEVRLGDVVFMEITVKNGGDRSVKVPSRSNVKTGTLGIELFDPDESTRFYFIWDSCPGAADLQDEVLEPGQERVLALLMVPVPRLNWTQWRFWNPEKWRPDDYVLDVKCAGLPASATPYIYIDRRAEEEMEALLEYYRDGSTAPAPARWDIDRPTLAVFGLLSFPLECSKPEKLAALEEILSPGSLRELVHATRLSAAVYDAEDLRRKQEAFAELLAWLDARPEIQRHWMAMQLYTWCFQNRGLGTFGYEIVDEVIRRLPPRLGTDEDYPESQRTQYLRAHPGADKYWKKPTVTQNAPNGQNFVSTAVRPKGTILGLGLAPPPAIPTEF